MSAIPPANKDEMRPHQQGDDDSVSITSTVDSDAQDVYEVEAIYTEFDFDDGIKYLVKWKGYSDVRCTWEPESSFDNPETILEWRKKKRAIKRGEIPNFDLEAWENQVEALEDARDRRKRRRRAKRLRLGLPVSSGEDEPEHSAEETQAAGDRSRDTVNPESGPESDSSSGDDAPLIRTRRPPRRPFGASASPAQQYRPLRSKAELVSTRVDSNNDSTAPQRPHPRSKPGRNERQVTDTASRRPTSVALNPARRRPAPVNPVSFGVSRGPAKKHDLASIVSRSRTSRTGTRLLPNSDAPKMWNLMSTRHKFDRASRIEPEPDPTQLELQRPAEWSPFQMSAALRRRNTANEDSLFVEQDDDVTMDDADTRASVSQPRRSSMRRSTSADSLKMATELPAPSLPSLGGRDTEFTGKRHSSMSHPVKKTSKVRAAKVGDRFREWNDGDVLCQVSYGFEKVEVGDVRLRHLSKDARRALLDLKKAHRIDVCFDDLCSLERFRLLTGEVRSVELLIEITLMMYETDW
jgi:chromo domain-containing protein 1